MNLPFILKSFEFYRLRSSALLRFMFLALLGLRVSIIFLPSVDHDFSAFSNAVYEKFASQSPLESLSSGNITYLALLFLFFFCSCFLAFVYANYYIFEHIIFPEENADPTTDASTQVATMRKAGLEFLAKSQQSKSELTRQRQHSNQAAPYQHSSVQAKVNSIFAPSGTEYASLYKPEQRAKGIHWLVWRRVGASIPAFLLLFLLSVLLLLFSAPFLALPFLFTISLFAFTPLNLSFDQNNLLTAAKRSLAQTQGFKMLMLLQFFFAHFLINIVESLAATVFKQSFYSLQLIVALLAVTKTFVFARLWAMFFLAFAYGRPSNTTSQNRDT